MFTFLKQKWDQFIGKNKIQPIEIFVRHCYSSSASAHKARFSGFSRERCYQNLLSTLKDDDAVRITFFLDTANATTEEHFLKKQDRFPVIEIHAGAEALSFLKMLDYVLEQKIDPETIVYFLEDDYIHKPDWIKILREGLSLPAVDYATLFDHKDKYLLSEYPNLRSQIFHTDSCHWRTTPSTTNTYAMRFKTLKRDVDLHRSFSLERSITADHEKFCALSDKGAVLISSIPGWATHVEPEYASPCTNWEQILDPRS
jgi:hypothetical protein